MEQADALVIGAGAVGLAVAKHLAEAGREVIVLEAEDAIGTQTSSRNSEVIHAGFYYGTDTLKAKLCVRGKELLYEYCDSRGIAYNRCGKIVTATTDAQIPKLEDYIRQGQMNGVDDLRLMTPEEVRTLEPEVFCKKGLWSPSTGIVDSHAYMLALEGDLTNRGGVVALESRVTGLDVSHQRAGSGDLIVQVDDLKLAAKTVVNCAGLYAPDVARKTKGLSPDHVPTPYYAIGHYYVLSGKAPFSRLIYPIATGLGLGIHVSVDMGGQCKFGPDARWIEGVDYHFDDSRRDEFVRSIKAYYPGLDESRLHKGYTGIRPKIGKPEDGYLDFVINGEQVHGIKGLVNLYGIDSPGLTSSLAIGEYVANMLTQ
ncbi:hypothetical protein GCM10017044_27250 [Kordiimonas sediminis]|uniref:FAD dependent oxidoreductase domain-containing protein n=1 Tax=Kordiimonas sediminis TaxID=1735581 RepID=A0A919EAK6_9PROT|nr:NAD(P)/FAD-dependent oxidoreductase [Kordiimonas sediminis]GHF30418.1 hypothetical protein GCM10017044_27250 [Kordiimonas sediminis]